MKLKPNLDIDFYYKDNTDRCRRRSYIHNLCERYDPNEDKCQKCFSLHYIEETDFNTPFEPDLKWRK